MEPRRTGCRQHRSSGVSWIAGVNIHELLCEAVVGIQFVPVLYCSISGFFNLLSKIGKNFIYKC
jgi:hypothetical protein